MSAITANPASEYTVILLWIRKRGNLANYRGRLAIVLSSATIWAIGCIWLVFHPRALEALGQRPIVGVVFACFSAASIYFCYLVAKRNHGFELD